MIRFACPSCQKVLQAPDERAGATVACPGCKKPLQIPAGQPVAAAAAVPSAVPSPAPQAVKTQSPAAAAATGSDGWIYAKGGQRLGPVSWTQLQNLAASGELQPTDKVWTKGMPKPVPAQEVAGLFAAQPDMSAESRPGIVKRVLVEIKEIVVATAVQNIRPIRFGLNLIRGRSLKRRASDSQLTLAQKAYELQLGDKQLRKQIQQLGEQANSVTANKAAARKALNDRKEALAQLVAPILAQESPPPGLELEFGAAKTAQASLATWQEQMKADRLVLFPADGATWRRVAIGGTLQLTLLLGLLILIWPLLPSFDWLWLRQMEPQEIYAAHARSVCLIKSEKSLGTGFLIKPGIIATNAHVIGLEPIESYTVTFPSAGEVGKVPLKAKLLYYDMRRDLAFLQVDTKIEPLRVARRYEFRPGQAICTIGCPAVGPKEHLENDIKTGVMSTRKPVKNIEFYQMSMAVNPGNSGGPVFDPYGRVIGVVTLKATQQEQTSFCIPLEDLVNGLDKLSKQSPEDSERMAALHTVEMVFFRVSRSGKMYSQAMGVYVDSMREARRRGLDINFGLNIAKSRIDPILRRADSALVDEVKPVMTKIGADSRVPADTRNNLVELWTTYQEMKDYVENPRGTLDSYEAKSRELTDRYNRVYEALRLGLGIEKEDLE
jgi:S1-C subfamily serine protease